MAERYWRRLLERRYDQVSGALLDYTVEVDMVS